MDTSSKNIPFSNEDRLLSTSSANNFEIGQGETINPRISQTKNDWKSDEPSIEKAIELGTFNFEMSSYAQSVKLQLQLSNHLEHHQDLSACKVYKLMEDDTVYQGDWQSGKRHGQGKLHWPDGSFYEGNWRNDFLEGQGLLIYSNRDIYCGEFSKGLYHGEGTLYFANAVEDVNDQENVNLLENRTHYSGEWKDNSPNGFGEYFYNDGTKYRGNFKKGRLNGKGEVLKPDGSRYNGEFKNGKKHGQGEEIWPDHSKYKGEYYQGLKHGNGLLEEEDGTQYITSWDKGIQKGKGEVLLPNGEKYKGELDDCKPHGYGQYEFKNGNIYIGEWSNAMFDGYGLFIDCRGFERQGVWKDNVLVKWIH